MVNKILVSTMQVYVIKNLENDIQFYKWKHIPDVIKIKIVIFLSQVSESDC